MSPRITDYEHKLRRIEKAPDTIAQVLILLLLCSIAGLIACLFV